MKPHLFNLPNRRKPLTAAEYIKQSVALRNRQACAILAFREACFRFACYAIAAIGLAIAGGCLIQFAILISR